MQKTFQWFFDKIISCYFFQCSHERNCILWKWYETFFEVRGRSSSEVTLKFPSIQLLTLLDFLLFYRCPLISITEPLYLFCLILFCTSQGCLLDGFKNWIKMNPRYNRIRLPTTKPIQQSATPTTTNQSHHNKQLTQPPNCGPR